MAHLKKGLAIVLAVCMLIAVGVVAASAVNVSEGEQAAEPVGDGGITVHYYCEQGTPTIYYWNSLPTNMVTNYPGPAMTSEGNGKYRYSFSNVTKINMLFVVNGKQSAELSRTTGEWWYKNNKWYDHDPDEITEWDRTDLREDSFTLSLPPVFMTATPATTFTAGTTQRRTIPKATRHGAATSRA